MPPLVVTSTDFSDGDVLPMAHVFHGAGGENQSPHLAWSDYPTATKSFAVTCVDPDAPTGSGWWHWLVVNIPLGTTELATGAGTVDGRLLPAGTLQLRNDYGTRDFGGAGPPQGDHYHRYVFAVHALDTEVLDVDADTSAAVTGFHITAHTLARGFLTATFAH